MKPRLNETETFTLRNARGIEVAFIARGGVIISLKIPACNGVFADVTPGYDSPRDYAADRNYFGALIGRYANRIAKARFELDGQLYKLAANDPPNHLHGGDHGFSRAIWSVERFDNTGQRGAILSYRSPHGDQGYPGALNARVIYTLTDEDELIFDYHATCDQATPVNLTQHAYFNLAGHDAGDILDHELTLGATRFTPVGPTLIPTGELRGVHGTPFDFTSPRLIGERIDDSDEQLRIAGGYDHNFVLDRPAGATECFAARLHHPPSGRTVEIHTTEPGIQFYSGNGLTATSAGKAGHMYSRRCALALETQHFPDSPNQPHFPSTILRPGELYQSRTRYRFLVG